MSTFSRRKLLVAAGTGLAAAAVGGVFGLRTLRRRPKHVVLIVVDALRADRLGCYGRHYRTRHGLVSLSPVLDDIAEQGMVFERCVAPSSWTLMSVPCILASRFPFVEGGAFNMSFIQPRAQTIAQVLRASGYSTHAIIANPCLAPGFCGDDSISRDFDTYDMRVTDMVTNPLYAKGVGQPKVYDRCVPAKQIVAAAIDRLERAHSSGKPAFVYAHLMDTHEPYTPGHPFLSDCGPQWKNIPDFVLYQSLRHWATCNHRDYLDKGDAPLVARARKLYNASVRTVDSAIGLLVDYLDRNAVAGEVVVAVTSDHGEEFAEHNWIGHARTLYDESLHSPLVFFGAGVARGARVSDPVSSLDIAPTILQACGASVPSTMVGRPFDLSSTADREPVAPVSALTCPAGPGKISAKMYALRDPRGMTLIRREYQGLEAGRCAIRELFDRRADPKEKTDIAATRPAAVSALEKELSIVRESHKANAGKAIEMDEERRRQLKALGYLGV